MVDPNRRVHAISAPALGMALTLLLSTGVVDARMYQWVSPSAGTVQLSGEPPAWYRAGSGGPRVWVYENGNLVDDTAIELPSGQREALREAAFRESEQREREEAVLRLERAARRAQAERDEIARIAQVRRERETRTPDESRQGTPSSAAESPTPAADGTLDEATIARLKAIIGEFDRRGGGTASR